MKLLLFVLSASALFAQVITTFAGAPKTFFSTAGLVATSAPISPSRLAVGPKGEVYFGDREANLVWRLNTDGTLSVVAGNGLAGFSGDGGPATEASFNQITALAVDKNGNLFITDLGNLRIRKVDTSGKVTTFAGTGQPGYSGDGGPAVNARIGPNSFTEGETGHASDLLSGGIAVDGAGNLYLADSANNVIRRIGTDGIIATVAGNGSQQFSGDEGPATLAGIPIPLSVAVDGTGNLYIGGLGGNGIRKVNSSGTISTAFAGGDTMTSLTVDASGNLYGTVDNAVFEVQGVAAFTVVAGGGQTTVQTGFGANFFGDGGAATSAGLAAPLSAAFDSSGNLFIADSFNERIRRVDSKGIITTVVGSGASNFFGDGGPATNAGLGGPSAVVVDPNGIAYIADTNNGRIRKVDSNGIITTFFDFTAPSYVGNRYPSFMALAPGGGVFVNGGPGIIKIGPDASVTPIAGGGQNNPANGGPALSAAIVEIVGLTADSAGNVYFMGLGAPSILKIDTSGNISPAATTNATISISCSFLAACQMATDSGGNVLAPGAGSVLKIAPGGTTTTIPVSGASPGDLLAGIAADSLNNLYISDYSPFPLPAPLPNHDQVLEVAPNGSVTPYAGINVFGYGGDGGPATQATLNQPAGLALDGAGDLFIADSANGRIREVLGAKTTLHYAASPASLSFTASEGGAAPGPQTVILSPNLAGLAFTAASNAPWLSVSPAIGSMPATLQITVDPSGLKAGPALSGAIMITAPNAVPSTVTISVSFTVTPSVVPTLGVDTQMLSFTALQGAASQTAQIHVSNTGPGSLSFTATIAPGAAWLSVSPGSGSATPGSPATLTVTASIGSLGPGTYQGVITITGAGGSSLVNVTLSVTAPVAVMLLSQSGLSFQAVAQGGAPLPQSFGILNTGQGSMSWSASAAPLSAGQNWLHISPASGSVNTPFLDVSLVTVTVDPTGLARGVYYGQIQVSAQAANSPQVMTVILTVLQAGTNPGPEVQPAGLIFTGVAGATPGSQDVLVNNPKGQADSFLSTSISQGAFTYLPASASVLPSQPQTVRVYPDLSNVGAGQVVRGSIFLQFSDGTPAAISVLTVVAPAGAVAASESGVRPQATAASGCSSPNLEIQFQSPQASPSGGFAATQGQPVTVKVQVTDDCGNLVESGTVTAGFSNLDPLVNLTHIGNGVWTGTWRPAKTPAGNQVTIQVNAFTEQGTTTETGQQSLTGTLTTSSATPIVTAGGVVQTATGQPGPVSPGSLITIYGSNLANGTSQASIFPLPQSLSNAQVLLGNRVLPLWYASTGQINAQVPFDIPLNTQAQIIVLEGDVQSVPEQLVIAAAQPGIFTVSGSQGAITKSDGITVAQPGTPANIGETVVIYCTGLGAVTPAVSAGTSAPAPPSPLSMTAPVTVQIGSMPASVNFSGLAPGTAGLYQVNAVVPTGIVTGNAVPVTVSVGGQTSPVVTMAVH